VLLLVALVMGSLVGSMWHNRYFERSSTVAVFRTVVRIMITTSVLSFVVQLQVNCHCLPRQENNSNYIPILYETDRILIINKPCGISHHNDDHDADIINKAGNPGVLQLLRQQRVGTKERLWGVHRLDKVTSGILVLAKDQEMASMLSQSFAHGRIQKIYFGISARKPKKKKQGWVTGGMVRSRRETWMLTKATTTNFAKTRFFTAGLNMSRISSSNSNESANYGPRTVIMFLPYTGKTHQLRVAAKSLGIPLMGDPLYESGLSAKTMNTNVDSNTFDNLQLLLPSRTMLHASGIHIPSYTSMDDPISVWCHPPFFFSDSTGEEDGVSLTLAKGCLHAAVLRLMTKHCYVPGILDAMSLSNGDSIIPQMSDMA
jgi:tRNA pseudouridine32 synthase / 23S rRNA pseudouridine746 synthase